MNGDDIPEGENVRNDKIVGSSTAGDINVHDEIPVDSGKSGSSPVQTENVLVRAWVKNYTAMGI